MTDNPTREEAEAELRKCHVARRPSPSTQVWVLKRDWMGLTLEDLARRLVPPEKRAHFVARAQPIVGAANILYVCYWPDS